MMIEVKKGQFCRRNIFTFCESLSLIFANNCLRDQVWDINLIPREIGMRQAFIYIWILISIFCVPVYGSTLLGDIIADHMEVFT